MSHGLRFLITLAISCAVVAPAYCADKVSWVSNIQNAVQLAQQDNKLIFVEVTSPQSCPVCRQLDKIERDPRVVQFLSHQYVNVKVDRNSASGEDIATRFQISGIPCLIVCNANGDLVSKQDGAPSDADSFIQQMNILSSAAISSLPVLQSQSEEAIWPLHQPPTASRLPMPQYGMAPQLGLAPQCGMAPQLGLTPQYGATPQYGMPQYSPAPQIGPPQYGYSPQIVATSPYGAAPQQYASPAPYGIAPQYGAPPPAVAPQYATPAPYGAPLYASPAPYAVAPQYGAPPPAVAPQYAAPAPYGAAPQPAATALNGAAPNSANQPNWIDSALQFLGIH